MTFHFVAAKTLQELELIVNRALMQEYCRAGSVAFLNGDYVMELWTSTPLMECTPVRGTNGEVLWAPAGFKETQKQEKADAVPEITPKDYQQWKSPFCEKCGTLPMKSHQYIPLSLHQDMLGKAVIAAAEYLDQLIDNSIVPHDYKESKKE